MKYVAATRGSRVSLREACVDRAAVAEGVEIWLTRLTPAVWRSPRYITAASGEIELAQEVYARRKTNLRGCLTEEVANGNQQFGGSSRRFEPPSCCEVLGPRLDGHLLDIPHGGGANVHGAGVSAIERVDQVAGVLFTV